MVNDVILIIMWSIVVVNSGTTYLSVAINFCVFLINDIYGLIRWKLEKKDNVLIIPIKAFIKLKLFQ